MEKEGNPQRQTLIPYLYVENVGAYLEFLAKAFGFETLMHEADPNDSVHVHAESTLGGARVMIGQAHARWGTSSARQLEGMHSAIYAYVDDVDSHCRHAREAGATIEIECDDMPWGDRMYTARDPEGNQWYFATQKRPHSH
jgi:uncharacterized glyoxalase superfamily protein PhnB